MSETIVDQNTEELDANDSINNSQDDSENVAQEEEQKEKLVRLPLARIKYIAKVDPDVQAMNIDATFLIAKSTELFIESLVREAYKFTVGAKKKIIQKKDVESAVDSVDGLMFLDEMLN